MRYQSLALAVATVLLSLPAFGQAGGDRRIIPSDDGFMETDLHTGAVTQCLRAPDGYRCAPAKTDPSALQAELERLRKENAELAVNCPTWTRAEAGSASCLRPS